MSQEFVVAILIGYAFGMIQSAYLISKIVAKTDIRQHGSGNAGASNITTIMGWKYGVFVGVIDVLKGLLAVSVLKAIYPLNPNAAYLAGFMAILGHIFPVYLKFRGGKGVATLVGMMGGIAIKWGFLFGFLVMIPAFFADYIVAGSLTAFIALPIATWLLGYPPLFVALSAALTLVVIWLHRSNIQRIAKKEEIKISTVLKYKRK